MVSFRKRFARFLKGTAGATIVEYAVALIIVTIVGSVVLGFGGNIAGVIDSSAGAF